MTSIREACDAAIKIPARLTPAYPKSWTAHGPADVVGRGTTKSEALAGAARVIIDRIKSGGQGIYVVMHDDSTVSVCYSGYSGAPVLARIRDGKDVGGNNHESWHATKDAADMAVRDEWYGPGVIIRIC